MTHPLPTLFMLAALAAAGAAAQACPRNADPALRGPAAGQDIVVNGLPVQIQQVRSADTVQAVTNRVERAWKEAGYDVKRQQLGPWSIVSALSEECMATLQLMDSRGTAGMFAIGQPAKARPLVAKREIAFPPGAHVVTTVSGRDGPRSCMLTTLALKGTVADAAAYFKRSLEAADWTGVRTLGLQSPGSVLQSGKVSAQRDGQVLQIALVPSPGGTTAVISRADAL